MLRIFFKKSNLAHQVLSIHAQFRNAQNEKGVEILGNFDVICSTQRLSTKIVEVELRHGRRAFRNKNRAPPSVQFTVGNRRVIGVFGGEGMEDLVDFLAVFGCQGGVVHLR